MGRHARDGSEDRLAHARSILPNLAVPETQHRPALRLQEGGTLRVCFELFGMMAAVKFDCDARRPAGKVDDVTIHHQLSGEPRTILPEDRPQGALLRGCLTSELSRIAGQLGWNALHRIILPSASRASTHPRPLPSREGRRLLRRKKGPVETTGPFPLPPSPPSPRIDDRSLLREHPPLDPRVNAERPIDHLSHAEIGRHAHQ